MTRASRFVGFVWLLCCISAMGDTVYLKDGKQLQGRVVKRQGFIEVHTAQQVVKVAESMVARIETDESQAAPASVQGEEPWSVRYARAMQRKIDLDFAETPASDVLDFLREWSGINIIMSPEAAKVARKKPITLKVHDMPFKTALEWVMRLSRLYMTVKHEAIYITDRPDPEYQLRTYDVRDLLVSIRDQKIESVNLSSGGSGGLSGLGQSSNDEEEYTLTDRAKDLMQLIVTIVEPTSWGYAFLAGAGDEDVSISDFF